MLIKQIIEVFDLLDDSRVNGQKVKDFLLSIRPDTEIEVKPLKGPTGVTDMIKIWIKGSEGKKSGGNAPTIGLLGRLGGIGARPEMTGFVSDGDGALCALVAWMLLSVGFSFYVENFANYSVIYGTLGAVIVLLIWLFLSAATLIMGAEVNGMIQVRHQNQHFRPEEDGYDRI